jgi:hypothetical protein
MLELEMIGGRIVNITEEERNAILQQRDNGGGYVHISRTNDTIFLSSISGIYETRKEQKEGRLHDGTRVIKQFGRWVDATNPAIALDSSYYPEILKDEVMTVEQYNEKKLLC